MKYRPIVLSLAGLSLLMAVTAVSFPRFAAEHGEACKSCHVNPNGGGARTEYGISTTAFNELCLPQTKKLVAKKYVNPRIGNALIVGFDNRNLVFDDGRIFRMQTDLFLTVEPLKNLFYHVRIGEFSGIGDVYESYALLTLKDTKYWFKIGRFYPAFGLHNEDHNSFNRARINLAPLNYLDGISVGGEFYGVNVSAEVFNQSQFGDVGSYQQGIYGLHLYRAGSINPKMGYLAGASARFSEAKGGTNGQFPIAQAFFGGLNYDRFTALGELDFAGKTSDTIITYASLTTRIEYGLYLVGEYNHFNGNRNGAADIDEFYRLGLQIYPLPYIQFVPTFTRYTQTPPAGKGRNEFFLMVHFGY